MRTMIHLMLYHRRHHRHTGLHWRAAWHRYDDDIRAHYMAQYAYTGALNNKVFLSLWIGMVTLLAIGVLYLCVAIPTMQWICILMALPVYTIICPIYVLFTMRHVSVLAYGMHLIRLHRMACITITGIANIMGLTLYTYMLHEHIAPTMILLGVGASLSIYHAIITTGMMHYYHAAHAYARAFQQQTHHTQIQWRRIYGPPTQHQDYLP